jgi:hypothetical protein
VDSRFPHEQGQAVETPGKEKRAIMPYVLSQSNTWHWCRNCSKYPSYPKQTKTTRPSWDLCEECKAKERTNACGA